MPSNQNSFASIATGLTGLGLATGNKKLAAVGGALAAGASLFKSVQRLANAGLNMPLQHQPAEATFASGGTDWRVKLSLPQGSSAFNAAMADETSLLYPLVRSGYSLIFPFTPQINLTHSATYNTLDPVHSNYPFMAYQNSKVEQISISGDFYCENSVDAEYWVAAVHYLRSLTKMAFGGDSSDAGQPPPVVKLNGYGAFVFNNVPVIVKSFTVDLPKDVDYIATYQGGTQDVEGASFDVNLASYAPVKSTLNVVLVPIYSREQVRQFSLDSFVRGDYVLKTDQTGFI